MSFFARSLDPKSPQRLNISSVLSFGPVGEAEATRLDRWERLWAKNPPGIHEKRMPNWKGEKKPTVEVSGIKEGSKEEL